MKEMSLEDLKIFAMAECLVLWDYLSENNVPKWKAIAILNGDHGNGAVCQTCGVHNGCICDKLINL